MKPEIKDSIENLNLSAAYASGYIRRVQALLDNGPVLEDLVRLQSNLRDLEVAWSRIWHVTHAKATSESLNEYGRNNYGTNYPSELSNYAYHREQREGKRTPFQVLDPNFLAGVANDLPDSKARETVLALRETVEAALGEVAALHEVIDRLEWLRSHPDKDDSAPGAKRLLAAIEGYCPVRVSVSDTSGFSPLAPFLAPDLGSARLNGLAQAAFGGEAGGDDHDVY